jgi:hypothetical protein
MYQNARIRGAAKRMVAPLESEGFEVFEARDRGVVAVSVAREEVEYFEPTDISDVLLNNESEALVEIVKPSFARGYKWTVRDSRGNFFIDVEDEPFLNQVQEGKNLLYKGRYFANAPSHGNMAR